MITDLVSFIVIHHSHFERSEKSIFSPKKTCHSERSEEPCMGQCAPNARSFFLARKLVWGNALQTQGVFLARKLVCVNDLQTQGVIFSEETLITRI